MAHIEQYSEESRGRLAEATAGLVGLLQRYAAEVGAMDGGTSQMGPLFDLNDELTAALAQWNERVDEHTGVLPLPLGDEEYDDDEDVEPVLVAGQVSVVSRWDLDITDLGALLAEGRAAHRRLRDEETEQDAELAIQDAGGALYAILHEKGEPLHDVPGLELVSGARLHPP